jgi:SAM-dependent methyltransferase
MADLIASAGVSQDHGLGLETRVDEVELLDDLSLPVDQVARAYRELAFTHRWLGNTAAILRRLPKGGSVLDVGCGHGALLGEIRRRRGAEVVGLDLRPAPEWAPLPILVGDAVTDPLPAADTAVAVCLIHHLSEADVVRLVRNVARSSRRFIVLELVRHPLPLALFRLFAIPFLGRINTLDGLTSIRRAYTPAELRAIVDTAVAGTGAQVRHTVAPFFIRQIVDIRW